MIRCCWHKQPDPRCMKTERKKLSPMAAMMMGEEEVATQHTTGICCRCNRRAPAAPWWWLTNILMFFSYCAARPERDAVNKLTGAVAEKQEVK